jgi:methyltransferase (TIGR00027 family)
MSAALPTRSVRGRVNASPVSNVSDTARWVAVYRAWESARPDALFHDPFAKSLAGERGQAIATLMPAQARSGWPMIARTKLIDDLIQGAIAEGCDCVINLAAGLDTRPYRLELPPSLRWIEADLPALIEEKDRLLADARPRCHLRRLKVDLTEIATRALALQDAVTPPATQALVITEGLLAYLDDAQVCALSEDLAAVPGIRRWILDIGSPAILEMMRKRMGTHFLNAPLKFAPPNGVAFFEALGWRVAEVHSIFHAAVRFRRLPWFLKPIALLPEPNPRKLGKARWSGVVQLTRAD